MAYSRVVVGDEDDDIFGVLVAAYLEDEEVEKACGDVNELLLVIRVRNKERRSNVVFCSRRGFPPLELVIIICLAWLREEVYFLNVFCTLCSLSALPQQIVARTCRW